MMQRYIKVVISLFILLTILSPILTLLKSGDHLLEIDARLDSWSSPFVKGTAMASPREIEEDAARLREVNKRQTLAWVESRVADMVKQDLLGQGYTQVANVQVEVDMEPTGRTIIKEIHVYAGGDAAQAEKDSAADQTGNGRSPFSSEQIAKVEPVIVRIDLSDPSTVLPTQGNGDRHSSFRSIKSDERARIRERISTVWEVSPDQILFHEATR
jgi:stage III sporulation protein AF